MEFEKRKVRRSSSIKVNADVDKEYQDDKPGGFERADSADQEASSQSQTDRQSETDLIAETGSGLEHDAYEQVRAA